MSNDIIYSVNTTLTGNVYAHNVTVNSGVTLITNGYSVICTGTFTNNGTVQSGYSNNGGTGTNGTGGSGGSYTSSYGGSGAGGGYYSGGDGGAGGNTQVSGGAGGYESNNGGNGSSTTGPGSSLTSNLIQTWFNNGMQNYLAGGGGAGGGSYNGYQGGNGGSGAYGLYIQAATFVNNSSISLIGQNGQGSSVYGGGGGGGGGGIMLIAAGDISALGTITTTGGTGAGGSGAFSTGGGTGGNGYTISLTYKEPPILATFISSTASEIISEKASASATINSSPSFATGSLLSATSGVASSATVHSNERPSALASLSASATLIASSKVNAESSTKSTAYPVNTASVNFPTGVLYYVPIIIANGQSSEVPAGFQQKVQLNLSQYSQYLNASNTNFNFQDGKGHTLSNWLQFNGSTYTYWIPLQSSIPANSYGIIYLAIYATTYNSIDGVINGMAPNLSQTYAQYDNGGAIFNYYANFTGNVLPASWTVYGAPNYSVNNGLSYGNNNRGGFTINATMNVPFIIDAYIDAGTGLNGELDFRFASSSTSANYIAASIKNTNSGSFASEYVVYTYLNGEYTDGTASSFTASDSNSIEEITVSGLNSSDVSLQYENGSAVSGPSNLSITSPPYITTYSQSTVTNVFLQYLFSRQLPPNGIMPSAYSGPTAKWVSKKVAIFAVT